MHEGDAPSPFHESDGHSTHHAISDMTAAVSDLFQEDAPLKNVEMYGDISAGPASRSDELR